MSAFGGFPDRFGRNLIAAGTYARSCFPEMGLGSTWEARVSEPLRRVAVGSRDASTDSAETSCDHALILATLAPSSAKLDRCGLLDVRDSPDSAQNSRRKEM